MKSTFVLEPLKGDCFLHETARWNFQLVLRKICSHDCELQPVATKSCAWTQPCAPGCAEPLPCPSAFALSPSAADLHMNFTAYADRELRFKSNESQMMQPSPLEIPFYQTLSTATWVAWIEFPELDSHLCHSAVRHGLWLPIGSHQDTSYCSSGDLLAWPVPLPWRIWYQKLFWLYLQFWVWSLASDPRAPFW